MLTARDELMHYLESILANDLPTLRILKANIRRSDYICEAMLKAFRVAEQAGITDAGK